MVRSKITKFHVIDFQHSFWIRSELARPVSHNGIILEPCDIGTWDGGDLTLERRGIGQVNFIVIRIGYEITFYTCKINQDKLPCNLLLITMNANWFYLKNLKTFSKFPKGDNSPATVTLHFLLKIVCPSQRALHW